MLSADGNRDGGGFGIRVGRGRFNEGACRVCDGRNAPYRSDILSRPVEVTKGRFRGEGGGGGWLGEVLE